MIRWRVGTELILVLVVTGSGPRSVALLQFPSAGSPTNMKTKRHLSEKGQRIRSPLHLLFMQTLGNLYLQLIQCNENMSFKLLVVVYVGSMCDVYWTISPLFQLYAEKVATRGLCAIAQAESLRYKLLGGLAVRRWVELCKNQSDLLSLTWLIHHTQTRSGFTVVALLSWKWLDTEPWLYICNLWETWARRIPLH